MTEPVPESGVVIENWLSRASVAAGYLAGLAGFVYLVGGVVMWLRFRTADLPADQGVALMSKEQLFVVGLRLMILPLLVAGSLVFVLALRVASERTRRLLHWVAIVLAVAVLLLLVVWTFGVVGWPPGLAVVLIVLVPVGVVCVLLVVRPGSQTAAAVTLAAVVALVLVVGLGVEDLRIDDPVARWCVIGGALLAISMPLIAGRVPRRLRKPPRWVPALGAVALAVGAALVFSSGFWAGVAIVLATVAVLGGLAMVSARWPESLSPRGTYRRWWLPVLAILAVGLVVPWSFASASWPIAIGLLLGVWYWRIRSLKEPKAPEAAAVSGSPTIFDYNVDTENDGDEQARRDARRRFTRSITITAVLAAAIVSIGRQLDEPVQLLHATVTPKTKGAPTVDGVYVNASGDQVYVGRPGDGTIVAVPRSEIRDVAVGPPDDRAPSPSLISRVIPGDLRFSARPLEVWCNGEKYHWDESGSVCRSHPTLFWKPSESQHIRDFQRLGLPVRVWCPAEARHPCSGWVILRSRDNYRFGPAGVPRPIVPAPVPFSVDTSRPTEVCLSVSEGQFDLMREQAKETPLEFEAIVSRDPEGQTVFDRGEYWVKVGPLRVETRPVGTSDCEPRLRIRAKAKGEAVTITVLAWPRTKSITPRQVAGAVRLSAWGSGGGVKPLGTHTLKPAAKTGVARFTVRLPAGAWKLQARYISASGIAYPQALDTAAVTTTRPGAAGGGPPAKAPARTRPRT